ncbi:MAG: HAD family hydrolase [Desulfosalsimonadaceae bacterium]
MKLKGIIFDINGTLTDILTDEGHEEIYRAISHFLTYRGIYLNRWEVKDAYYRIMDAQRKAGGEKYPEFDAVAVWREFLTRYSRDSKRKFKSSDPTPRFLAEMYRGISRFRLALYPEVKAVLDEFRPYYKMSAVSDGQSAWAVPELKAVGLDGYFNPIIVSGDFGYRKPDRRLFQAALTGMGLTPEEVIFVGNDMYRDVYGAGRLGMKTVFFSSNQGGKEMAGVNPDYIIYRFAELRQAVDFLKK